ncbi:MAG: hypothetical protein Q8S13_08725, partial [Dehalococcoidia bacterium]|nr:hypothetical protein [Dehalococcoidia bacterium]
YMPREHRASHEAAGASGLRGAGVYPHNGAVRLRVERACADRLAHLWVDGEPTSQIDPWVGIIE